jgi:pantoate--beta-alanine ligase
LPGKRVRTVSNIADCRCIIAEARTGGRRIGFVPTMGGLHAGHASLIRRSREAGDFVVVSIFVNPTQFGPNEDFSAYPRPIEDDRRIAAEAGCDLLFTPVVSEIYAPGDQTRVRPGKLGDVLCGAFRPGHFEGVCTVVAKLFNIVQPDAAYFGQKDAQQAVIIRRMAADLKLPIAIVVCPIVREPDGLAMSTRNQYLSPQQRRQAASLYRALCAGRDRIAAGERSAGRVIAAMRRVLDDAGPARIEYIAIVDPETFEEIDPIDRTVMLALAVRLESARLIDNLVVDHSSGTPGAQSAQR